MFAGIKVELLFEGNRRGAVGTVVLPPSVG